MTPWRQDGADLLLALRLTPKAAKDGIGGLWTDSAGATWLCAAVRAVPEKGKANAALIALLAKALAVPKSKISLEAGDTNRLKRVRIAACDAAILTRLEQLAEIS